MQYNKTLLAAFAGLMLACGVSWGSDNLDNNCLFEGQCSGATKQLLKQQIDAASKPLMDRVIADSQPNASPEEKEKMSRDLLKTVREGERALVKRVIDKNPEFFNYERTWDDYYWSKRMDASVLSWSNPIHAGIFYCTATAYADWKTASNPIQYAEAAAGYVKGFFMGLSMGFAQKLLVQN